MNKMFFDKCGGCCGGSCPKKNGEKSGYFGNNPDKGQGKSEKCNHGPDCHCGHEGCKDCKCNHGSDCHCGHDKCPNCRKQ